jgi:tetratricopeptide (TPR) repeat protein
MYLFPFSQSINHQVLPSLDNLYYFQRAPINSSDLFSRITLLPILLVLLAIGASVFFYQKKQLLITFLIGFILISFAPVLQIIPITSLFAEKYMYIGTFGVSLLLVLGLQWVTSKARLAGFALVILMLIIMIHLTFERNKVWKDPLIFWSVAAQESPRNAYISRQLGATHMMYQNIPQAIEWYEKAISLDSNNTRALINLGFLYSQEGRSELALRQLTNAQLIEPNNLEVLHLLARLAIQNNDIPLAQNTLKTILELNPIDSEARDLLREISED